MLKEKFVECYNEFINKRYQSDEAANLQTKLAELLKQEQELTALRVNYMVSIEGYKTEMDKLRSEIKEVSKNIEKVKIRSLTKDDYMQINEFSDEKVDKFIEKVTNHKNVVTFIFINGVRISRSYSNGQPGNQKGWAEKRRKH